MTLLRTLLWKVLKFQLLLTWMGLKYYINKIRTTKLQWLKQLEELQWKLSSFDNNIWEWRSIVLIPIFFLSERRPKFRIHGRGSCNCVKLLMTTIYDAAATANVCLPLGAVFKELLYSLTPCLTTSRPITMMMKSSLEQFRAIVAVMMSADQEWRLFDNSNLIMFKRATTCIVMIRSKLNLSLLCT